MTVRIDVAADLYAWAQERSRPHDAERANVHEAKLARNFPRLEDWQSGKGAPTLRQLENFAKATHTPIGFFFLDERPQEKIPIPDFRTIGDAPVKRPTADLLETIYQCQRRQDWYHHYALENHFDRVPFVGSFDTDTSAIEAAASMREELDFSVAKRGWTWSHALTYLRNQAVDKGVLVMVSGVVNNNTHRKLDPSEFRGFALVDRFAPVVFVNGADTKAAQIFTLAHELAHIWLGKTAVSDVDLGTQVRNEHNEIERWCNRVAAEFLVPEELLRTHYQPRAELTAELNRLARYFKSSTLVMLRRIYDLDNLSWSNYRSTYNSELDSAMSSEPKSNSGGNFYNTLLVRVSKPLAQAVATSTLEGTTMYRDACRLLGIMKQKTFRGLCEHLGVG